MIFVEFGVRIQVVHVRLREASEFSSPRTCLKPALAVPCESICTFRETDPNIPSSLQFARFLDACRARSTNRGADVLLSHVFALYANDEHDDGDAQGKLSPWTWGPRFPQ